MQPSTAIAFNMNDPSKVFASNQARPTVGSIVKLLTSGINCDGRAGIIGKIIEDRHDGLPFKVEFEEHEDGGVRKDWGWFRENDVEAMDQDSLAKMPTTQDAGLQLVDQKGSDADEGDTDDGSHSPSVPDKYDGIHSTNRDADDSLHRRTSRKDFQLIADAAAQAREHLSSAVIGQVEMPADHHDTELSNTLSAGAPAMASWGVDWSSVQPDQRFELRVVMVSASNLISPQYRVGDLLSKCFLGKQSLVNSVYAELQLPPRIPPIRTFIAKRSNDQDIVNFDGTPEFLVYHGEPELQIRIKDHRRAQACIRGDPLIGETRLPITDAMKDGALRQDTFPLTRDGIEGGAGSVVVHYQLLPIQSGGATMTTLRSVRATPPIIEE